jgi:hypothetical protein
MPELLLNCLDVRLLKNRAPQESPPAIETDVYWRKLREQEGHHSPRIAARD